MTIAHPRRPATAAPHGRGYAAVHDQWAELRPAVRHFNQLPEWAEAFDLHLAEPDTRWLAREDGRAVAALRMRRETVRGLPVRTVRNDFSPDVPALDAVSDGTSPFQLLEHRRGWDVARLTGLRGDSAWLSPGPVELTGRVREDPWGGISVLDLPPTADALIAGLSKKMRENLRRGRARAEALGQLTVRRTTDPDEIVEAYERFVTLEASGWKGAQGTSISHTPPARRAYRHLLVRLAERGDAFVSELTIAGTLAASTFWVRVGDTAFMLKLAFDQELERVSPFQLLIAEEFGHLCEDPSVTRLDFCAKSTWLSHWKAALEPTYDVVVFNPRSPRGLSMYAAWRGRQLARGARDRRTPTNPDKEQAA